MVMNLIRSVRRLSLSTRHATASLPVDGNGALRRVSKDESVSALFLQIMVNHDESSAGLIRCGVSLGRMTHDDGRHDRLGITVHSSGKQTSQGSCRMWKPFEFRKAQCPPTAIHCTWV
jgi:hypothetical protein